MRYSYPAVLLLLVMSTMQVVSAAEKPLIFSAAPSHSMQETKDIYTPIVNFLSNEIGRKIILEPAINFIDYTNKFKKDRYDIIFDGPHFVGWRIAKYQHTPIARLPGQIKIIVATRKNLAIDSYKDLAGQRVCTFASPNMLTMSFLEYFPNPAQQPVMVTAKGFKGLEKCLLHEPRIYAAVLRDKMWNKMKNKQDLKILFAPERGYPERTFSTSNRIDAYTRSQIAAALLSDQAKPHLQKLLKTFKREKLIAATTEEYEGLGLLLKNIWGFEL